MSFEEPGGYLWDGGGDIYGGGKYSSFQALKYSRENVVER